VIRPRGRGYHAAPAVALVLALGLTACGADDAPAGTTGEASTVPAPPAPSTSSPPASGDAAGDLVEIEGVRSAGRPASVRVPSLGIDVGLDELGVDDAGVLDTPPHWDVPGWYAGGPRPGETGPSVIAGHVDSPTGPAVFARLAELRPGDLVEVADLAGGVVRFRVDHLDEAPQDDFPTQAVYGPTPDAQLRLITCSGDYDAAGGGYQDNLIVYATEVSA
jgi:hypothetical protein